MNMVCAAIGVSKVLYVSTSVMHEVMRDVAFVLDAEYVVDPPTEYFGGRITVDPAVGYITPATGFWTHEEERDIEGLILCEIARRGYPADVRFMNLWGFPE